MSKDVVVQGGGQTKLVDDQGKNVLSNGRDEYYGFKGMRRIWEGARKQHEKRS